MGASAYACANACATAYEGESAGAGSGVGGSLNVCKAASQSARGAQSGGGVRGTGVGMCASVHERVGASESVSLGGGGHARGRHAGGEGGGAGLSGSVSGGAGGGGGDGAVAAPLRFVLAFLQHTKSCY